MGKSPLVTVIVPVYNTAPYLKECFASISSQTYQRLEIIPVDDGSTDGSDAICERYAQAMLNCLMKLVILIGE